MKKLIYLSATLLRLLPLGSFYNYRVVYFFISSLAYLILVINAYADPVIDFTNKKRDFRIYQELQHSHEKQTNPITFYLLGEKKKWLQLSQTSQKITWSRLHIRNVKESWTFSTAFLSAKNIRAFLYKNKSIFELQAYKQRKTHYLIPTCPDTCQLLIYWKGHSVRPIYFSPQKISQENYVLAKQYRLLIAVTAMLFLFLAIFKRQNLYVLLCLSASSHFFAFLLPKQMIAISLAILLSQSIVFIYYNYRLLANNLAIKQKYFGTSFAIFCLLGLCAIWQTAMQKLLWQFFLSSSSLLSILYIANCFFLVAKRYKPAIFFLPANLFFLSAQLLLMDTLVPLFDQPIGDANTGYLLFMALCYFFLFFAGYWLEELLFHEREQGLRSVIQSQEEILQEQEEVLATNRQRLKNLRLEYTGKEKNFKSRLHSMAYYWEQILSYLEVLQNPKKGRKPAKKTFQSYVSLHSYALHATKINHILANTISEEQLENNLSIYIGLALDMNFASESGKKLDREIPQSIPYTHTGSLIACIESIYGILNSCADFLGSGSLTIRHAANAIFFEFTGKLLLDAANIEQMLVELATTLKPKLYQAKMDFSWELEKTNEKFVFFFQPESLDYTLD
ncbi:MAG: hypothetical protein AAF518_16795 [Spirochaetota bacterium]